MFREIPAINWLFLIKMNHSQRSSSLTDRGTLREEKQKIRWKKQNGKRGFKEALKNNNQKPRKQRAFPGRWDAVPWFNNDLLFPSVILLE